MCLQTQSLAENPDERKMEQKEMLSPLNCIWEPTHTPGVPNYESSSDSSLVISFTPFTLSYITLNPLYHCYIYIFMYCISETAFMFTCVVFYLKKEVICFSYQFQLPALSLKIEVALYLHSLFPPLLKGNRIVLLKFILETKSW